MAESFTSPFLSASLVRLSASVPPPAPRTRTPVVDASSLIPWARLVDAAFALDSGWALTGFLPEGVSSQQFWAKVTRAAGRKRGRVRVAVRGGEFWVWSEKKPEARVDEHGLPLPKKRARGWVGELVLALRGGEKVVMGWELTQKEKARVRRAARMHGTGEGRSMRKVHFGRGYRSTTVQWVGE